MRSKSILTVAAAAIVAALAAPGLVPSAAAEPQVTVHKTPWCGCCGAWVEHLRDNGFDVTVHEHEDLDPIRVRLEVPLALGSCHTGEVEGYAIEGHVPAADVHRLLQERPQDIQGLSVPGMPAGSPGMEMGDRRDPYDVVAFGEDGHRVFNEYRP